MKMLDLCIYLFAVFRQQRSQLVEDYPGGYDIAGRRAIDLLTLPLIPADFLVKHPRAVLESLPSYRVLSVVLAVMPPSSPSLGGSTILSFILRRFRVIL
jgi:hypothetical protein